MIISSYFSVTKKIRELIYCPIRRTIETRFKFANVLWKTDSVQLSYTGNPNTAGKCNKPKTICKNKNTIEIIKSLSDCNCNDKGNSVSLLWLSVGVAPRLALCVLPKIAWERPC